MLIPVRRQAGASLRQPSDPENLTQSSPSLSTTRAMSDREIYSQTAYLDRAKELRWTAAQVRDLRAREILIGAAEGYERMATRLGEPGQQNLARITGPIEARMTSRWRAWLDFLGLRRRCGQAE
jgi:hypothetical protein